MCRGCLSGLGGCRQGAVSSKGSNGSESKAVAIADPVKKQRKRGGNGQALKQLFKLLLSIAGPKIIALVGLALARTALSNRLARLQVSGPHCRPYTFVIEPYHFPDCFATPAEFCRQNLHCPFALTCSAVPEA